MSYEQLAESVDNLHAQVNSVTQSIQDAIQRVNNLTKVTATYPFAFVPGTEQYDVKVISGDPTMTTAGMALWVEGSIVYPQVDNTSKFTIPGLEHYTAETQFRLIATTRYDDVIATLTESYEGEKTSRTADYRQYMEALQLEPAVAYVAALSIVRPTQTVTQSGVQYRPKSTALPITTTNWVADVTKFVVVGDMSLREEIVNTTDPTKGAVIFGRSSVTIASIKDLATVPLRSDISLIVRMYHPDINNGGGGRFHYDPLMPKSSHNGGTIFSPTVPWAGTKATLAAYLLKTGETDPAGLGCWVRRVADYYTIPMFGGVADWNGTTGFDNRPSIEASVAAVYKTVIPKGEWGAALTGSILLQNHIGKRIEGAGTLHKMGPKGIFSLIACIDVCFGTIGMDGQLTRDETDAGSILTGTRLSANYAFAISFKDCHDCSVTGTTVYDFAWDGIVAQGSVAVGGATATQSTNIKLNNNTLRTIRGSQLWFKAVKGGECMHNYQSNPTSFAQKANAVFVVEWCEDIEVAHNRQYYIGDNGVGIGEMVNRIAPARNKNIQVHHNLINMTRYHAILVAPGEDCSVHHNIVYRAGAKSEMTGTSGAVTCGAITVLGGGDAPANLRVKVHNNIIHDAYEHGIYALDRTATVWADASEGIEIDNNTIYRSGKLTTATRLASSGITTQLQRPVSLQNNIIDTIFGDGIRIFGDARPMNNTISNIDGIGLHIPKDTIWNNVKLSSPVVGNNVSDVTGPGIVVATKDSIVINENFVLRAGRGGAAPGTENTTSALNYAGISLRSVKRVSSAGNEMRECGSGGMVTQFCEIVKDNGSIFSNNGQVFTSNNFKSGAYLEGDATTAVKATFISPIMDGGTTQYYPMRLLYGHADGVALDPEFINHTNVSLGITTKKLINI